YKLPPEKAVNKLREDLAKRPQSPRPESVVSPESVVGGTNLLSHPCLYTSPTGLHPEERVPQDWHKLVNQRRQLIAQVVRSVGRVEVEHVSEFGPDAWHRASVPDFAGGCIAGTCFVVAPNIVMTNSHVARHFV